MLTAILLFLVMNTYPVLADTLHVPKDHKTIQGAIDAAKPGDTVLVESGRYRESIRLKERLTVRSAGDESKGAVGLKRAESTVIDGGGAAAKGPAVVMADGAVFDGFTVTRVGVFDQKEYDKHYAERGENLPDERGAVGAGDDYPALSIPAVTAVVKRNIICENAHAGIGCTGGDGKRNASIISGNVCYKNMGGGIGIAVGATPTVEGNRCYNNLRGGIGNRKSAAVIVGNECFDNVRAGIGIREGAKPIVRGNKCYKNRRAGIGCRMDGTSPVIEDNDCYSNGMAGIGCRDSATPIIRKNRCYENELAGIGVSDRAQPVIVDNTCYRNKEAGIGVESGARATITKNECYENERAGIGQRGDAETIIVGNYVHHNKAAGIGFEECKVGKSTVLNNKVIDNGQVAIGIHSGWRVRICGNELSRGDGLQPVVMVYKGAEADFTDNSIRGSGVAGIRTEGIVRIAANTFVCPIQRKGGGPPQFAVWGLPGSDIAFTGNTVQDWRHALVAEKSVVTATDNKVSGYWQVGIRVTQPTATTVISGNLFQSEAEHPGVTVTGGAAIVQNNPVKKPSPKK
jgi:parallel beta-helix repeat protein